MRKRLLLLVPTSTYRTEDFVEAAARLDVDLVVASERPSTFQESYPEHLLTLDFARPDAAAASVVEYARRRPLDAVVPVDDRTTEVAAAIAGALGLRTSPRGAVAATRNKYRMREALARAGIPSPPYTRFTLGDDPGAAARRVAYPCVLKPTVLSASRGVIRADDPPGFVAAFERIAAILREDDVRELGEGAAEILVEGFLPGVEVALEGLLVGGALQVLALFDKPDPLDGPFFEETLYVTPSRLPAAVQAAVAARTAEAARALGLREGPVHAELRIDVAGGGTVWLVELAARSIGGLCSRTLRFGTGLTLEEIILRHALGSPIASLERERAAAGVMMLPIPRAGVYHGVDGVAAAEAVPGIGAVTITAHPGQTLVPLPEGAAYLGFVFARAADPAAVEAALREAHRRLVFAIEAPADMPAVAAPVGGLPVTLVIHPAVDAPRLARIIEAAAPMTVVNAADEAEARRAIAEADAFFGKLTPALLAEARRLSWVQAPTASLEHYVFPELVAHPAVLTNMRGLFSDVIADQVFGYVICFARNLHHYIRNQATGRWAPVGGEAERSTFAAGPGMVSAIDRAHLHLGDATLGVVGLGQIGGEIARRGLAFGMRVIAIDPIQTTPPPGVAALWRPERLPALLAESDFVVIAAPHTPETYKLFRREAFRQMKPSAFLINIGRGVIVDLADLTTALQAGEIAGAGLDVFETEPLPADHPLWRMPNVIITPHVAGASPRIAERHLEVLLDNLRRFRAGQPLRNVTRKADWF